MEEQVLTAEQMQELIAMGVDTSKASMCWINDSVSIFLNCMYRSYIEEDKLYLNIMPTFTLHDILEMLPKYITIDDYEYKWNIMPFHTQYVMQYLDTDNINPACITFVSDSLLEAAFYMLKWCKTHGYI